MDGLLGSFETSVLTPKEVHDLLRSCVARELHLGVMLPASAALLDEVEDEVENEVVVVAAAAAVDGLFDSLEAVFFLGPMEPHDLLRRGAEKDRFLDDDDDDVAAAALEASSVVKYSVARRIRNFFVKLFSLLAVGRLGRDGWGGAAAAAAAGDDAAALFSRSASSVPRCFASSISTISILIAMAL